MSDVSRLPADGSALAAAAVIALSLLAAPHAGATEPSFIKDIGVRQVPMAKIDPTPASTSGTAGSTFLVRTAVDRPDARYTHGDALTLTVEVTEDAYVWVFDTGTSGKVHQIFPNRHVSDNFVRAGTSVAIPGKGAKYELLVSHPTGTELLTVIASKDKAPLTENLIDPQARAGAFLALLGDAVSVAKDLKVSLKQNHPKRAVQSQVVYIE